MASSLEELGDLIKENSLTFSDLTFIINFMKQENISPQLAMRRIKAFDSLKDKLENNSDKMKIEQLQVELNEVKNHLTQKTDELDNLKNQKTGLESQKEELETKSELLSSEREELQRQLEMLRDMQMEEEEEEPLNELTEHIENLKDKLLKIMEDFKDVSPIISPITEDLNNLVETGSSIFDTKEYTQQIRNFVNNLQKSANKVDLTRGGYNQNTQKPDMSSVSRSSQSNVVSKTNKSNKVIQDEKKVSEKEEQVLNLFIEFVEEANDDKSFKERVSTICDMDEAYQYLGSIGLSQVYSFASRGLEKKSELMELLNSWKKEGVPR